MDPLIFLCTHCAGRVKVYDPFFQVFITSCGVRQDHPISRFLSIFIMDDILEGALEKSKKIVELQKRVTETGKNVLSRTQRWQRISTGLSTTCDVVLTFSQGTQEEHIQWFIELLHTRVPELVVQLHKHRTSGQSALYLTACFRDLLMGAEVLGIRKPLAAEHGGGLREFSMEELDLFDGATDETSFLSSGERSYIVYNYLMSLCAREGDAWTDEITFSEGQPLTSSRHDSISSLMRLFPTRSLLMGAEVLGIRKPLAAEHGGGLREFSMEELDLFDGATDETSFLSSGERSYIVYNYLMSLCAREGDAWTDEITFSEGQPLIRSLQSVGFIHQIFPVHQMDELKQLKANWVRGWNVQQPLEEIRRYFGAQIALYFAWLGHYTTALLFPSIVGLLVFLFVSSKDSKFYYLVMGFLSLIWSTIYLEHWKRTSTVLTHQWGIWDAPPALLEEPRAAFKVLLAVVILLMDLGYRRLAIWLTDLENHRLDREYHNHLVGKLLLGKLAKCPITGRLTRTYPAWRRTLILFFFTGPVVLLSLVAVVLVTFAFVRLQEHADAIAHVDYDSVPLMFLLWYAPKVSMVALQSPLVFRPFSRANTVRRRVNSPRLSPRNSVTIGVACCGNPADGLGVSKTSYLLTDLENHRLDREYHNHLVGKLLLVNESPITPQELEATLLPYDGPDDDFLEMFIQFGYVSMFSCVFPAAGVLALLNNLIEIRGDAFKLTASFQRPFIQSANDIGIWQLAMSFMGYAAVIVNVGLLNVSGAVQDLFPQLDAAQSILLLVVVEHCIFVLYYALAALIPDTPSSVLHQIAKLEHRRREALRTLERESMREYRRHRSSSRTKQTDVQAANEISG
ncbi:hypothetical protein AHF37_02904 [Paragonimus kellicotti]|nr:hypothetical protein AHF37_02904 [Paragonimus kellicotti]